MSLCRDLPIRNMSSISKSLRKFIWMLRSVRLSWSRNSIRCGAWLSRIMLTIPIWNHNEKVRCYAVVRIGWKLTESVFLTASEFFKTDDICIGIHTSVLAGLVLLLREDLLRVACCPRAAIRCPVFITFLQDGPDRICCKPLCADVLRDYSAWMHELAQDYNFRAQSSGTIIRLKKSWLSQCFCEQCILAKCYTRSASQRI